jgi:undecaprenyl pyrophosphate synthase
MATHGQNKRFTKSFGHEKNGTKSVRETVEVCAKLGISNLHYMFFYRKLECPTKLKLIPLMRLLVHLQLKNELKTKKIIFDYISIGIYYDAHIFRRNLTKLCNTPTKKTI